MHEYRLAIVVFILVLIPFLLGVWEKRRNDHNVENLKVRVNVNGIRGKSTITRMITAILEEAGYHVVGKTTGTASRMIYWGKEEEEAVKRKPRGVTISEQIHVIEKAVKAGADALVCECMAVKPDYQKVYQHQILHGNVTVIVNVLEDHLDEMGPTLDQLAWAFGDTIPYNGAAVVPLCEWTEYFREIAEKRHSKLIVVDPESVSEEYLSQFDYKVFSNNCAMALGVAKALDIPEETAYSAMLKAHPDPGATRIVHLKNPDLDTWFVNGFAANEPSSTLDIWESVRESDIPLEDPVVIMNCRPDRVNRSMQFAHDCFPKMGSIRLMVIGEKTHPIDRAYKEGKLPNVKEYISLENKSVKDIMQVLTPMLDGHTVFGVGNIHGIGGEFIDTLVALNTEIEGPKVQLH